MLERVAVHQTRLRTPGLGLDGKGVALGARGLVLLPSIDRLVAFLALYTSQQSLADLLATLSIDIVRSELATREATLSFAVDSSDRLDRVAEIARLAGGYAFTGTSRHFVQYRDAASPFGYDVGEILASDADVVLYHASFSQAYAREKQVSLTSLLLRLMPQLDPTAGEGAGARWIVAEQGLGPALLHYLVRSRVEGEVALGEWPESALEDEPVRRYLFRVPELPARIVRLVRATPGLALFDPVAPGVAVEVGWRHPVGLRACPVFDPSGLVLFRGARQPPLVLPRLPALGDLRAFASVELRGDGLPGAEAVAAPGAVPTVRVALRLMPSLDPWRRVTATWVRPEELPVLRRLAYALGTGTLERARVAITAQGAFLRDPQGIESIPIGTFFAELCPGLFAPAGYSPVPAVAPEVLERAIGSPEGRVVFLMPSGTALGIDESAFASLDSAILEGHAWAPLDASALEPALATELPEIVFEPLGLRPMRDVAPAGADGESA